MLKTRDPEVIWVLCWISIRIALQEADITIENVLGSCVQLIKRFLSTYYHIEVIPNEEPHKYGMAIGRRAKCPSL